jgi:hypothetical protein
MGRCNPYLQRERMRRIGVLMNLAESDPEGQTWLATFRQRLWDLAWGEGSNIQFEYRWTVGSPDRARGFAAELVGMKPDLILVSGGVALTALTQETRSVPVVFVANTDPVATGLVASLGGLVATRRDLPLSRAHPDRNGWKCSRRSRLAWPGWSSSIRITRNRQ